MNKRKKNTSIFGITYLRMFASTQKNAREEMRKSWATLLPPEFVAHRRTARKEMLLAARELINHALDRLETHEETTD